MKYGEVSLGQVEAILNKLGGHEGLRRFLAGELVVIEKDQVGKPARPSRRKAKKSKTRSLDSELARWTELYRTCFGVEIDSVSIKIPERPSYTSRLVVIAKDLTLNRVVKVYRDLGVQIYLYSEDLDKVVTQNDRTPTETYAIWLRDVREADEEFANKSANDLKASGVIGVTLLERLLLGLDYFKESREHLDQDNWTLCAGSRDSDGDVPSMNWNRGGREVRVGWYSPDLRGPFLRARAVVS